MFFVTFAHLLSPKTQKIQTVQEQLAVEKERATKALEECETLKAQARRQVNVLA